MIVLSFLVVSFQFLHVKFIWIVINMAENMTELYYYLISYYLIIKILKKMLGLQISNFF